MSDDNKSNITISGNIYDYKNFEKNIIGFNELKKIYEKTNEQNKLYRKGALPHYCINELSWGFIKLENGEIVQSCRCEINECKYFNTCMNEPYSERIVREPDNIFEGVNNDIEEPEWRVL
jgi:hypothetical protein